MPEKRFHFVTDRCASQIAKLIESQQEPTVLLFFDAFTATLVRIDLVRANGEILPGSWVAKGPLEEAEAAALAGITAQSPMSIN
jgi:hypothetical protein